MRKNKVLIVGAGLAGIGLYVSLDKNKFDVTMVERGNRLRNLGFAVILMPTGVRALRELGVADSILNKIGKPIHSIELWNEKGQKLEPTHLGSFQKRFDKYFVVERADLYAALWKQMPKGAVCFGTYPIAFKQTGKETVVSFSGNRPAEKYDLVVIADGSSSSSRAMVFPNHKAVPQNRVFIWAWLPRKNYKLNNKVLVLVGKKYGLGFLDVRNQKRICAFLWADKDGLPKKITQQMYQRIWTRCFASFPDPITKLQTFLPGADTMYFHEDRELNLKNWSKGSILFIGDAAHARSVLTGAGTALALEDSVVLGRFLNRQKDINIAIRLFIALQYRRAKMMVPVVGKKQEKLFEKFFSSSLLFRKRSR